MSAANADSKTVDIKGGASDKALQAFKQAIRKKYDLKERAFKENDVMGLVDGFYAKNALLVEEKKVVNGYEQVVKMYEELVPGAKSVGIQSNYTYLSKEGSVGYDYTTFHVSLVDGNEFDLKLLFIWEKINGEWFCISDMYIPGKF
ncbi:hypothetical protein NO559_15900 [Dasania sp. GY-MA-18]|uniref:DUF4440 domain-containing protein n=1 Tax=Dasania phycosphaerae TaxID=2950436 RepID=A0A9J6RQR2_9GAMM|nr:MULTISPECIES: hypothetical protein [Dasania]MCR8924262.1 hypothetical protein [Dasania sp. GY-MA-18]MCZ0866915.1 hypothetical protein [Dasania phycosphaerae]MCZ0870419.1 hypothetical protein [Dasania phycosphaerae]